MLFGFHVWSVGWRGRLGDPLAREFEEDRSRAKSSQWPSRLGAFKAAGDCSR